MSRRLSSSSNFSWMAINHEQGSAHALPSDTSNTSEVAPRYQPPSISEHLSSEDEAVSEEQERRIVELAHKEPGGSTSNTVSDLEAQRPPARSVVQSEAKIAIDASVRPHSRPFNPHQRQHLSHITQLRITRFLGYILAYSLPALVTSQIFWFLSQPKAGVCHPDIYDTAWRTEDSFVASNMSYFLVLMIWSLVYAIQTKKAVNEVRSNDDLEDGESQIERLRKGLESTMLSVAMVMMVVTAWCGVALRVKCA